MFIVFWLVLPPRMWGETKGAVGMLIFHYCEEKLVVCNNSDDTSQGGMKNVFFIHLCADDVRMVAVLSTAEVTSGLWASCGSCSGRHPPRLKASSFPWCLSGEVVGAAAAAIPRVAPANPSRGISTREWRPVPCNTENRGGLQSSWRGCLHPSYPLVQVRAACSKLAI